MHVLATAGHVDHGKSTLVRALTGMEPDRWAEERRRGMTIDLGFAWTSLPGPAGDVEVAFVDVPGHERFVPNMLAGVGPAPAVLFVVAADEGWMPQSGEHLDALDALGVRHGLLAVTRSDLADPVLAAEEALEHLRVTSLGNIPTVAVSGATGEGLDELRTALGSLVAELPVPDRDAPVRLWLDRSFTIRGSGTVVTGTLPAGRIRVGDELLLEPAGRRVRVRGLQTLGRAASDVDAVARVAVNLRGIDRHEVQRGDALVTPDAWLGTDLLDVRLSRAAGADVSRRLVLHVGAAAVAASVRALGDDCARLRLDSPLPLRIGDRALLRDPGASRVVCGTVVLDVRPPPLARRGAPARRAAVLAGLSGEPDGAGELRRRGIVRLRELVAMGAATPPVEPIGEWLVDPDRAAGIARELERLVRVQAKNFPLDPGLPLEAVRARLELPDARLVPALAPASLEIVAGRLRLAGTGSVLPPDVELAVRAVEQDLLDAPYAAPEAGRLAELGLGSRQLAAAVRAGRLLAVADGLVVLPGAPERAAATLSTLDQPFTTSEARAALATTRRVAIPLLEMLDRRGLTSRLPDDRRRVRGPAG